VSALGFGCGNVGGLMVRGSAEDRRQVLARALEAGITYFDTAPSYGDGVSEQNLGATLSELGARDSVVVGTKLRLTTDELSDPVTAVRLSILASLERLGRDAVDLIQLHSRITETSSDRGLASDEVAGAVADAMRRAVEDGLVRAIGITGLGEAASVHAVVRSGCFDTVQSYFNVLNPSAGYAGVSAGAQDFEGLIDAANEGKMGVIAIRVMAAGAVTGSEERAANASPGGGALVGGGDFRADIEKARRLADLARDLELESTAELGFRFVLAKPGLSTALVGFSDLSQLEDALRWLERGPLPEAGVARVIAAMKTDAA
jgi:aryl-alcohol dehydrogenase-like predicted oxidoreductase